MGSILVRDWLAAEKANAQLVHHGVGFERMITTLALQEPGRNLAQLRMH